MEEELNRNKERLEAGLTWLCELEVLKQRQESLVLGALELGDSLVPGCQAWGDVGPARSNREHEQLTLRRQLNRLQGAPSLLMLELQQQLSDCRLDSGFSCGQDTEEDVESPSASSSGFYDQSEGLSPPLRSNSSPNLTLFSHRPRSVDAYMLDWEGHLEGTAHTSLPRSFSAPYPPLEGIAESLEEEEEDEENQWSSDHNESLTTEMSLKSDVEADPTEKIDDGPTEEDIQQAMRVETYILGLLQRKHLRSTAGPSSDPDQLHTYPLRYPQFHQPEWHEWTVEEEDKGESLNEYYINLPGAQYTPISLSSEEPESFLEFDQFDTENVYVSSNDSNLDQPVYIQRRGTMSDTPKPHIHTCCNHTCVPTTSTSVPSQKWALLHSLVQRGPEELSATLGERKSKMTLRSRSEDTSFSHGWATQAEPKYYTVGRNMARQRSDEFYPSRQRLWSSSADLSQEEDEGIFREDGPDEFGSSRGSNIPFLKQGKAKAFAAPTDGSDSSLSETFSPGTSSVSSDSDEGSGLVWPQQIPPRVSSSSSSSSTQNPTNAVVKIKASHALKKKIMRFRSGSLKLMTTV
ncbi:hypothetical protein DNTS_027586 [Danionella cerebrum]|uniref:Dishevelled-binding antagonist of beta-catenin 3 n=1 Tax=Danionella cerebrum TaxID=2873325 RepID=A0A553QWM0_9TELE|nr:hypothetical protein DNTS_027586 [Danionella translucida]